MRQTIFRCASLFALAACVLLTNAGRSTATPLPIGGLLFPAPIGGLNGGVLVGQLNNIGFVSATFTGALTTQVFQNDPTNPFGLGGVTFTFQIANTSPFAGEIDRLTDTSFAGFLTDVHYVPGTGALAPAYFDRSSGAGSTVGITFAPLPIGFGSLQPGQNSDLLIVYTDAPNFAATTASVIDGSTAQVPSFAPTKLIPEPSTVVLAGLAAVGMSVFIRRRRA